MSIPPLPLTGSCRCGAIKLRATAAPLMTAICHCIGCQKMTASAYSLSALFKAESFEAEGETVIGGLHGPERQHHHCGYCMSWLFTRITGMDEVVNVRATMFDETGWFVPFMESSTDKKLKWVSVEVQRSYPSLPYTADFPDLMNDYAAWAANA